jgi:hypothetical protein
MCRIVSLFNSKELNPKNAQLIFNTHDTNLLSTGLFRRKAKLVCINLLNWYVKSTCLFFKFTVVLIKCNFIFNEETNINKFVFYRFWMFFIKRSPI